MTKQEISFYDKSQTDTLLNAKANTADLATVATTGSYNDLTNKPTIPAAQVNSDWNAESGVAQILNKPDLSQYLTSVDWGDIGGSISDQTDLNTILTGMQDNAFELVSKFSSGNYSINANETKVIYYTFQADANYDYFSFISIYDTRVNPMNVLGIQNTGTGTQTGAIQITNMSNDNIAALGVYFYITRAKKRGAIGQHWIYGIPTQKGLYDRIKALENNAPTLTDNTTYYTLNV